MNKKDYTKFSKCRFCYSKNIKEVINLGKMPLAGGFLKNREIFTTEKKYLLILNFCNNCFLLQTNISIDQDKLFKKYFYFSSSISTLVEHFNDIAKQANKLLNKGSFIVEIGCNDGEFIKALKKQGFKPLGVDPATNVVKPLIKKGVPIINAYFTNAIASKIVKRYGKADAIYSFHSLAHIPDMHEVVKGIKTLLKPEGYLAFEVHYLGNLLNEMQYDMIYHEHLHYYSLLAIENMFLKYDMEIFKIERNNQRAGSIIFYIQNKNTGKRRISIEVDNLKNAELKQKFNKPTPYLNFSKKIEKSKNDLLKLILDLNFKNKNIAGYGASGRGTIILNYCSLNQNLIKFVVDDSKIKQGKFMPGTHNPILPPDKLISENIDYAIVFAWPFIIEVKKRNKEFINKGGKFILPLPKVTLINA